MREKYEDDFQAGMGAETVKKLLATVGLNAEDRTRMLQLLDSADQLHAKAVALKDRGLDLNDEDRQRLADLEAEMDSFNGLEALSEIGRASCRERV